MSKRRKNGEAFMIFLGLLGCCFAIICGMNHHFNLVVLFTVLVWGAGVGYCILNFRKRFLFFFLLITIFTFLLGRPFIRACKGEVWWNTTWLGYENVNKSIYLILLSLCALFLGSFVIEFLGKKKENSYFVTYCEYKETTLKKYLQAVSMVVYYISMCFFIIQELEKLFFMHGKQYVEFYSKFEPSMPGIIYMIASFMKYSLCIYLATFPNKRRTMIALSLFEISAFPSLLIGIRGQIILNSIFILVYFIIRNYRDKKEKWINKFEKIGLALATPFVLIFMTAYSYIRSDVAVPSLNPFKMILSFFEAQGVSFDVVTMGVGYQVYLPDRPWRNYTFGGIIDYLYRGRLGQILFHTQPLTEGNSVFNGTQSNSLAHNLSYISKGDDYLAGQGWGTSYVLENYTDWGYIGVFIFSLILGALLIYAVARIGKNVLMDTIIFVSLMGIFYIPRAEATGWIAFLFYLQFWACVFACYVGAFLCTKWRWVRWILEKVHLVKME